MVSSCMLMECLTVLGTEIRIFNRNFNTALVEVRHGNYDGMIMSVLKLSLHRKLRIFSPMDIGNKLLCKLEH